MKLLAIETATHACSAALWVDGQRLDRTQVAPRQHSALVLAMVDELLVDASLSLGNLDAIAFGQGPGSFMGVRLAVGIAQGLAFGAELPVIPVSTLQALAQVAYQAKSISSVIAGWDARMNGIYWGAYTLDEAGIMQSVKADALNEPNEITLPAEHEWLLAGNAWDVYREKLDEKILACSMMTDIYPQASAVVEIGANLFSQGKVTSVEQAEPVYLRTKVTS